MREVRGMSRETRNLNQNTRNGLPIYIYMYTVCMMIRSQSIYNFLTSK